MERPGKHLEDVVALIQDSLKNTKDTIVETNVKLRNRKGRLREFDVVIKTRVIDFEIVIVIECKDHKRPISASLIESFYGKCDRVDNIHKKVFVSSSGYQADALNAADDCKITLLRLEELSSEEILSWTPKDLKLNLDISDIQLYIDCSDDLLDFVSTHTQKIFFGNDLSKTKNTLTFLKEAIAEKRKRIWSMHILDFVENDSIGKQIKYDMQITSSGLYIKAQGEPFRIIGIQATVKSWLSETIMEVEKSKRLYGEDENKPSDYLAAASATGFRFEIVKTSNQTKLFINDHGVRSELKRIGYFEPGTNRFIRTMEK